MYVRLVYGMSGRYKICTVVSSGQIQPLNLGQKMFMIRNSGISCITTCVSIYEKKKTHPKCNPSPVKDVQIVKLRCKRCPISGKTTNPVLFHIIPHTVQIQILVCSTEPMIDIMNILLNSSTKKMVHDPRFVNIIYFGKLSSLAVTAVHVRLVYGLTG